MFSEKFIYAGPAYSTYETFVPSPYFRKSFFADGCPERAEITVCGLGFYELFINGEKITKGLLAPYISNPDDLLYYDVYDLLPYLKPGENVIGFQLGNGFMNCVGGQIWDLDDAPFRGAPRLAFSLELTENGRTVTVEADESVKTAPSPVIFDDERCGCFYDARLETPGWALPGFDDSAWAFAAYAPVPKGETRLCEAEPIVRVEELKPVSVRKACAAPYTSRGDVVTDANPLPSKVREGYLYDFGVNTAGIARLKIRGERGQQVDIQFGEYLNEEGQPDYSNICFYPDGYSQRDIYILKGEGEEVFEPVFTYHGARYAFVIGLTAEQASADALTFIVCHSDLKERGDFSCSDETANALQRMCRNSDLSNFHYFPTDCPHREKNGWTGDANASAEHLLLNLSAETSLKEWMRNVYKAQNADGAVPGIVPTAGWGFDWGNGPAWDAVLSYIPWFIYAFRGDREVLEECADPLDRYLHYLTGRRDARGLLAIGLGDWVPVTVVKSPLEFTDSAVSMNICAKAADIFDLLGQKERAAYARELRASLRASIRKYLIDLNTFTVLGDCQTSQAAAIYFDVFDPAEKPAAFQVLKEIIARTDGHIDCGFIGIRVLFRVLADMGEADLAYEMITRPDYPSYGNFVTRGLTAIPEDFLPADAFPNSLNHHFLCDISAFFIEYIAGIRVNPYLEDPCEVLWQPCFIGKLTHAESFYDTAGGRVSVRWERCGEKLILTADRAENVHGQIRLPGGYRFEETQLSYGDLESGSYTVVRG